MPRARVRTDSVLSTGMSSASSSSITSATDLRVRAKNAERLERKRQAAAEIATKAEIMFEWLDEEEKRTRDLSDLLEKPDHPDSTVELTARKKQLTWIRSARTRLRNKLRLPPEPVITSKDPIVAAWAKEAEEGPEDAVKP